METGSLFELAVKSTLSRFEGVEEWHAVGSGRYESRREYPVDRDGGRASFGSCHSSTTSRTSSPPPKNHPRSLPNEDAVDTPTHAPRHNRTQGAAAPAVDTRKHTPPRRRRRRPLPQRRPRRRRRYSDAHTSSPHAGRAAAEEEDVAPRDNAPP